MQAVTPDDTTYDLSSDHILVEAESADIDTGDVEPAGGTLAAVACAAVALLWAGGMIWVARGTLRDPEAWPGIAAGVLSLPVLLALGWLLAMRTSRREARRFTDAGAAMRAEASRAEASVARLSAAVRQNADALAGQVATLAATGDAAQERLAALCRSIAGQVERAEAQTRALAEAADTGQAGIGAMLAALPRAQAELEAASGRLDTAGRGATERAAALSVELVALADRAGEADAMADGTARVLHAHAEEVDRLSRAAAARLESAAADTGRSLEALAERLGQSLEQAQHRLSDQGEEALSRVAAGQAALDGRARESAETVARTMAELDALTGGMGDRIAQSRASGDLLVENLRAGLVEVDERLGALHAGGFERTQQLSASIGTLGRSADAMAESLKAGEAVAARTIGTAESLLIALDSATREVDETLPGALARLDERVAGSRLAIAQVKPELIGLVTGTESTQDAVEAIGGLLADQRRMLDALSEALLATLSQGRVQADALGRVVDEAANRARGFADDAAPRMAAALGQVRAAADAAAGDARRALADVVPEAAAALHAAGADAMRRASADSVERQVRSLAAAAKVAEDAAARAGARVAAEVEALIRRAEAVETQVAAARTEREDADRNQASRLAAGLIEAMNTASVDVARAFSADVADTNWATYLSGDRGVFTRRAVRLLDDAQAGEVARLYDGNTDFRDATNRYVRDFETMLRRQLDGADGQALGIALLSSDQGKLYVALAQGIERLG